MGVEELKSLLQAGLPLWILIGGGLLALFVDALVGRRGALPVYLVGIVSLILALYIGFDRWTKGQIDTRQDLLVLDSMTLFFIFVVICIGLLSLLNAYSYLKISPFLQESSGILKNAFVSLVLFAVVGMVFMFASDHLLVNFIGLETMSLAIYIMVGSNRRDSFSCEAAMKYYVMGSVASAILLMGIALFYASFATFKLSEMAQVMIPGDKMLLPQMASVFLLVGVFFKLSVAPFHFWTPDAYTGAPAPVTGFMASGVKVAAFAFLIRLILSFKNIPSAPFISLMQIGVIATLIVGNLGALFQDNIKRMLAYSSIAHAGYLLLGLFVGFNEGHFDPAVTKSVLFYLLSYSFVTLGAFGVLSVLVDDEKEAVTFKDIAGLGYKKPFLAFTFSVFMISFLGIPPTVGFIAKYGIFSYAVENGYYSLAIFGFVMSLASAYYYLRPIMVMYFKDEEPKVVVGKIPLPLMISLMFCLLVTLYLGVRPDDYLKMAELATSILQK